MRIEYLFKHKSLLDQFYIFDKIAFMNNILVADRITKQFGNHFALKNVSLEIPKEQHLWFIRAKWCREDYPDTNH